MTQVKLRMTHRQHKVMERHLFPGDGQEAVLLALCGRGRGLETELVLVHEIHLVPYAMCRREESRLIWPPTVLEPLLVRAAVEGFAILKVHSHPNGYEGFSTVDDASDRRVFESVFGWLDSDLPHVSAVMLEGGRLFGRAVYPQMRFSPLRLVTVVGDSVTVYSDRVADEEPVAGFTESHAQIFGWGTANLLRDLRVAVVGCSGTGSPTIEQLGRLGVGELVLIDPDRVEEKNLNRIVGASFADIGRQKVDVLRDHVERMGLGTEVCALATGVEDPQAISAVAASDFVFGCVDSLFGRHVMCRLAQYYLIPYVDTGVKLEALPDGTINQVAGAVHYLAPDGPNFMDRGVFSGEDLRAEDLARTDPAAYEDQRDRGYVRGVEIGRPAVVSVNTTFAGLAVTEMLARLHPFRMDENSEISGLRLSLSHLHLEQLSPNSAGASPRSWIGRGETVPPLGMPSLGGMV